MKHIFHMDNKVHYFQNILHPKDILSIFIKNAINRQIINQIVFRKIIYLAILTTIIVVEVDI